MSSPGDPRMNPDKGDLRTKPQYIGWLVWFGLGLLVGYRGVATNHMLSLVAGATAAGMGAIMLAMNAIEQLRPWRKAVALILVLIISVAMAIYQFADLFG